MHNKLLVVYNTCGIYGRNNVNYYIAALDNLLKQDLDDCKFVLSSCLNKPDEIAFIQNIFGSRLLYNIIDEKVPVNVTFNRSVNKFVKEIGEFEGYVFVDSGIDFQNQTTALRQLYDLFKSGPYGMVSSRTDGDTGYDDWFGTDTRGDILFNDHLVIPVGMAVNLHVQIFSNKLLQYYGKLIPDIFAGQCTESVFSFLCAALHTKWVVHKDVILHHNVGMDGPSSGFPPHVWQAMGNNRWNHLFGTSESILDIIGRGIEYGMGYEEVSRSKIVMHKPEKFDKDGYALDDRLKVYIKKNLFLPS